MEVKSYSINGPWKGRLAIVPRPRGGDWLEDEVRAWREAGLDVVVSLLTTDEIADLDLDQEANYCEAHDLQFLQFPIPDLGVPSSREAGLDLLGKLDKALAAGKGVGLHCRQGIGRSGLIAASLLVLSGLDPQMAFQRVSTARGFPVPETSEQRDWVIEFARELATSATRR
jgi:protein-tyrosine phosphatase